MHSFAHLCINLAQNCTNFALKKLSGFTQPTHSRIKEFSPIGKLPLENLEDVFIQSSPDTAKEYTSDMAKIIRKLFRFHIFNCLKTKNYHIENPTLELNALARYETQEFLKYKFNKIKWNIFPE